ncbi:hypothetical protein PMIN04_010995 [Paraphaeosphaeria minitans]
MHIQSIPMWEGTGNNYAYLVTDDKSKESVIIDPANPPEVLPVLKEKTASSAIKLSKIINTHHHHDHAGGNSEILKHYTLPVIGGKDCTQVSETPAHKSQFTIGESIKVTALHTPCHTQDSICFYFEDGTDRAVFTGDTLFIGGCGRFFEGNATEMHKALNEVLAALPDDTKVYPGHEYTKGNVRFAKKVLDNEAIRKLDEYSQANKETQGKFTIGDEKQHNVFMRVNDPDIQKLVGKDEPVEVMKALRAMKDRIQVTSTSRSRPRNHRNIPIPSVASTAHPVKVVNQRLGPARHVTLSDRVATRRRSKPLNITQPNLYLHLTLATYPRPMNSGVAAAHTIKSMDGRICKGSQKNFLKTDNALTPPPCKWHLGKYWKKLWTNDIRPTVAVACNTWFHLISIILGGVFNLLQAHLFTAVVAWLFPRPILKLLKYSIVGAVGHLVLGLASLRWFKEYRNETLPLIKLFGYEFTAQPLTAPLQAERKYRPHVPIPDRYLAPIYTTDTDATTSSRDFSSEILVQTVGVVFFQGGLLDKIENRRLLRIQITKAFLERTDNLIRNLTDLLADLAPPIHNAVLITHLRIANKDNLQVLAKQIRRFLYKSIDKKHFDHAWWHGRNYPATPRALDLEELNTWVKICLHMLVMKKRVKLQFNLDAANEKLVKELLKSFSEETQESYGASKGGSEEAEAGGFPE